jgi:trans-aconitate methyltransferase
VTDLPKGDGVVAPGIDTTRPSVARVYDYALGGKDNYEVDRELYRQILEIAPETPEWARENRRWLGRVITWLARDAGVSRFIDAGSGLPTAQNTHQIAQGFNPAAEVVYVDNDPAVIAHGRALLLDNGQTYFTAADLTRPDDVLGDPPVAELLEADEPVALVMALMLHHIPDTDVTREITQRYLDVLPSGSYLAISHAGNPRDGSAAAELATVIEDKVKSSFPNLSFRTPDEIGSFFGDLEMLEPGVVQLFEWAPPGGETPEDDLQADARRVLYGGVARKP